MSTGDIDIPAASTHARTTAASTVMLAERAHRGTTAVLSVAPMMDCTDRHFRFFIRQITRHTLLYTEMIPMTTIVYGDRARFLNFSPAEHPIALQLGGDDPATLAECARIAEGWGYDEINLNIGCPSSRVSQGNFGACLMAQPETVARSVATMRAAVAVPVTVKHRIGIDQRDRYEDMAEFVRIVADAGADRFTVHARKAWLKGLSPKQNRTVPPLRYHDVHRLKQEFPHLDIEINGGFTTLDGAEDQLAHVDAVMIGRAAYNDPWLFADADRRFFHADRRPQSRTAVAEAMIPYAERECARGVPLHHITRHMLQLFFGQRGAREWRRYLGQASQLRAPASELIPAALARLPEQQEHPQPNPTSSMQAG